ncbi:MAG: MFS transporter [Clostridiales bacterium]|nr:MFS transporter [Clostridiales bacterium]
MSVSFLGSALAGKTTETSTKEYKTSSIASSVFVVYLDEEGNETSEVREYYPSDTDLTINVTGSERLFNGVEVKEGEKVTTGVISVSSDSADVTFNVSGVDMTDGRISLSADKADPSMMTVVLYGHHSEDEALQSDLSLRGTIDIDSNLEVERVGFKYFSMIIGVLFVIFIAVTCICIKEKSSVDMQTASVGQMFKALVQNDQAMTVVLTIVLFNTATYITSNLLIYFFKYDLAGNNWQGNYTLFNTFAGGVQILAMMLFFPLLRKAFNTIKIFYIGVFSAIGGYFILLAIALGGAKSVYPYFVPGFFIMGAVGILNVICTVFLANTVDYGELKNRRRDESVIFSMQTFVVKLASGVAALVASICLAVFNIQKSSDGIKTPLVLASAVRDMASGADTAIDNSSVVGLRLVMTLAPILVLFIALMIFKSRYILTDKKLEEISSELKTRS